MKFDGDFNDIDYSNSFINEMEINPDSKIKIKSVINGKGEEWEEDGRSSIHKIGLFNAILEQSMGEPEFNCSSNNKYLLVKGYNVLMKSVVNFPCFSTAKHVHIYAINKVFLDEFIYIDKRSMDLAIISPNWYYTKNLQLLFIGRTFQYDDPELQEYWKREAQST